MISFFQTPLSIVGACLSNTIMATSTSRLCVMADAMEVCLETVNNKFDFVDHGRFCMFCGFDYADALSGEKLTLDCVFDHLSDAKIGEECFNAACKYCGQDDVERSPSANDERLKNTLLRILEDYCMKEEYYDTALESMETLRTNPLNSIGGEWAMVQLLQVVRETTTSNHFMELIVDKGVLGLLVDKMKEQGCSCHLFGAIMEALAYLLLEDCDTLRPHTDKYAQELVEKNVIQTIVSIMETFQDDVGLLLCCTNTMTAIISATTLPVRTKFTSFVLKAVTEALKGGYYAVHQATVLPDLFIVAYETVKLCVETGQVSDGEVSGIGKLYFLGIRRFHDHEETKKACMDMVTDLFHPFVAQQMIEAKELEYLEKDCQCGPAA